MFSGSISSKDLRSPTGLNCIVGSEEAKITGTSVAKLGSWTFS